MFGWTGKIVNIDLASETARTIEPGIDVYKKYLGGKGLAGFYLRSHVQEQWDSPSMPLLFFTGPLVGTPAPTSGRMTIMSRSPLTGTIGDSSVGGKLGTEIKRSGWDGIIMTGKARRATGIEIIDGEIFFRDADEFAGLETDRALALLKERDGGGSYAIIGPAAENGVMFASIAVDGHFFSGRNGLGLVMASKGVKYLHVRGTGRVRCHDSGVIDLAREEIFRLTAASPALKGEMGIGNYGTGALYDLTDARNMMPTDNFRRTKFPGAPEMNAVRYRKEFGTGKTGCAGCHILCKMKGKDGMAMPEFETMSHFSALLDNSDMGIVVEANRICNSLGMDTISAAATLACHSEILGKRLAPREILELLSEIGYSKNRGAELKLGSHAYAAQKGAPGSAVTVKKLELSAYDPRGACGMALAFATSTRGACHLQGISHIP